MHGTTIKHKARILPAIGIAGLVLITGAMIAPVSTNDTYALMPSLSGDSSNNDHAVPVEDTTYAEATVQLTMDTANSYTSTITPNSMTDKTGRINLGASIKVTNSGGYTIKLSTPSNTLTSTEGHTIDSTTTVTTLDQMEAGKYGYYATTTTDSYYHPIELEKTVYSVEASSKSPITETKHVNIGFGTKVGGDQPAGNYTNTFTLSVVSKPGIVATFGGISTMQELTPAICKAASENDTAYLKDARDNNYYWVTKLADGNCWMSQNLALDLTKDVPVEGSIVNTDGTVSAYTYTPEATTIITKNNLDAYSSIYKQNNNAIYSWNEGEWVLIKPEGTHTSSSAIAMSEGGIAGWVNGIVLDKKGVKTESQQSTTSRVTYTVDGTTYDGVVADVGGSDWQVAADPNFTASATYTQPSVECPETGCTKTAGWAIDPVNKVYDAHYLVGNYYQWQAAVATNSTKDSEGNYVAPYPTNGEIAPTSICPINWRLPLSGGANNSMSGSFYNLLSYYNLTSFTKPGSTATDNIAESPLFFTRAGGTASAGNIGRYANLWSAVSVSSINAYGMYGFGDVQINTSHDSIARISATPIRCLVLPN